MPQPVQRTGQVKSVLDRLETGLSARVGHDSLVKWAQNHDTMDIFTIMMQPKRRELKLPGTATTSGIGYMRLCGILCLVGALVIVAGCSSSEERAAWKAVVNYYNAKTPKPARSDLKCDEILLSYSSQWATVNFRLVDGAWMRQMTASVKLTANGDWEVVQWIRGPAND